MEGNTADPTATARPTKSQVCRTYSHCDTRWRRWSRGDLPSFAAQTTRLDMDDSIQGVDHCPFDDKGRGTEGDAEIRGRIAFEARNQQFLRWYVQGIQYGVGPGAD